MTPRIHLFTSESVTEGHPDKVADQVSDAVLDAMIEEDEVARVACETLVTTGLVLVAGGGTTGGDRHAPACGGGGARERGSDEPEAGVRRERWGVGGTAGGERVGQCGGGPDIQKKK